MPTRSRKQLWFFSSHTKHDGITATFCQSIGELPFSSCISVLWGILYLVAHQIKVFSYHHGSHISTPWNYGMGEGGGGEGAGRRMPRETYLLLLVHSNTKSKTDRHLRPTFFFLSLLLPRSIIITRITTCKLNRTLFFNIVFQNLTGSSFSSNWRALCAWLRG